MALVDIINSWIGPVVGILVGRVLPQKQLYDMADFLTKRVSKDENSDTMRVLRHNQALIQGKGEDDADIIQSARMVLYNVGQGYADWYKAIYASHEELIERCEIDDGIMDVIEQSRRDQRGLIFVGPHMSSFNMFLLGLGARKVEGQVLSYPQPRAGYRIDNGLRQRFGLDITPISIGSLRQSLDSLRRGGFVLTGVDRPDVGGERMTFFQKQVLLPVGHARLAIKSGARMLVGTCQKIREGHYHVKATPIETQPGAGEKLEAIDIAQRALKLIEGYIQERPEEWMLFLPIHEAGDPIHAG